MFICKYSIFHLNSMLTTCSMPFSVGGDSSGHVLDEIFIKSLLYTRLLSLELSLVSCTFWNYLGVCISLSFNLYTVRYIYIVDCNLYMYIAIFHCMSLIDIYFVESIHCTPK